MPPREAVTDELLGQVVIGNYEVSLYRRVGAVLAKAAVGVVPVSHKRISLPPFPSLPDLPFLLDRDIELAAVKSLLHESPPPIVEISGRSGVGKTALVRCLTDVLYIDAAGLRYKAFLQHLYERAFDAEMPCAPTVDCLRALFSSWKIPVVIDGFEGSTRELHTILDILKRVPVVYTTMDPLHLDPSVAELRLTGLRPDAARELFERCFGASVGDDPDTMEFVNGVLEGNPLLIGHAAALARGGALLQLQGPEPLAALTFNHMTIAEQQVFAAIAGFGGARPSRATAEIVSEVGQAGSIINALIARRILQTNGELLWISRLMRPVLTVAAGLIRYDAMFSHADVVLSQAQIPRDVVENPQPFLAILRLAATKGHYNQVARNARSLADALLLQGKTDEAREACELVRSAANELHDPTTQAWAQHQLGTLSGLAGDIADGVSWLESAEALRERNSDLTGKQFSLKNAVLLRKAPVLKKGGKGTNVVWDVTLISWSMGLIAFIAVSHVFGWSAAHVPKNHGHSRTGLVSHMRKSGRNVIARLSKKVIVEPVFHAPPPVFVAPPVSMTTQQTAIDIAPIAHHVSVPRVLKKVSAVPRIAQFTASARRVVEGGATALCFRLSNATSAFLEPVGKLSARSGCVHDTPRANTYYTLYAYNQNGMASASLTVHVLPAVAKGDAGREAEETRVP